MMADVVEICRDVTKLNNKQIEILHTLGIVCQVASDLCQGQITIYTRAQKDNTVAIVEQVTPNTSFYQYRPNEQGETLSAMEEPLIWYVITHGEEMHGQREWTFGKMVQMHAYPLYDETGEVFAAVSFEFHRETTAESEIRLDTAYKMLCNAPTLAKQGPFQPLSANDGILIADGNGKVFSHNHIATSLYRIIGVYHLNGRYLSDRHLNLRFQEPLEDCTTPQAAEFKYRNIMLSERSIPIVVDGKVVRVIILITDITELKKKEKELLVKSAVIQEIHHRVKNNLQTIASLLRMQARRADSEQVQAALNESINRILSISVVHEFLSQQDAETIDIAEVAKNILDLLAQNMLAPDFRLQTVFNGETAILPSEQASNLAIVINELVQNSIEHGFKGRSSGLIGIDISLDDGDCCLEIYDNGNGLPIETEKKQRKRKSLGIQIIRTLIEDDMGGEFTLYNDGGARAKIRIPQEIGGR